MTDFLFDGGFVTNLAVIIIVAGYLFVGFACGYIIADERAERRSYKREDEAREYWRAFYSNRSNY